MPNYWYSASACKPKEDDTEEQKEFKAHNAKLVASVKPYFMSYIYPEHRSRYNKFVNGVCSNSQENWNLKIDELISESGTSPVACNFIESYQSFVPLGLNQSTMNRICWKVEQEMDGVKIASKAASAEFDKDLLKTDAEYSVRRFGRVKTIFQKVCADYYELRVVLEKSKHCTTVSTSQWVFSTEELMNQEKQKLYNEVQNENELCNALIDICYKNNDSKFYLWQFCSKLICSTLSDKYKKIHIVEADDDGDIVYNGKRYQEKVINLGGIFDSGIE